MFTFPFRRFMCLRTYYGAQEGMQREEDNTCFPSGRETNDSQATVNGSLGGWSSRYWSLGLVINFLRFRLDGINHFMQRSFYTVSTALVHNASCWWLQALHGLLRRFQKLGYHMTRDNLKRSLFKPRPAHGASSHSIPALKSKWSVFEVPVFSS